MTTIGELQVLHGVVIVRFELDGLGEAGDTFVDKSLVFRDQGVTPGAGQIRVADSSVGEAFSRQYRDRILVGLDPVHESDEIEGISVVRVNRDYPLFECLGLIELFDVAIDGGFLL